MTPEERIERMEKTLDRHIEFGGTQIDKYNAAIRDLVIVSRALVDSQTQTSAQIKELREAQKDTNAEIKELREAQSDTDVKLKALIDTVDKIVRHGRNGRDE